MKLLRRSGRLPSDLRAALVAEGVLLLEEELSGSVTYRHYRAPHRRSSWAKESTFGAIAVTDRRLVVWAERMRHIDAPLDHPVLAEIEIAVDRPERVLFAYDAGATHPDRSGRVEVRLRTPQAALVAALLGGTG